MIMKSTTSILITSIGKRVQLIKHLKKNFKVIGVDAGDLNPAKAFVDEFFKIPRADEEGYIEEILRICEENCVEAVIPLYEGEFNILQSARKEFEKIGVLLVLSNKEILDMCKDKEKTFEYFFMNTDIKVPTVYNEQEVNEIIENNEEDSFPLIIKPKDGMGSQNVFKINNIIELDFFRKYVRNGIVQEFIEGQEYTVDVLTDLNGQPIYIVPRLRIEVRAGEVVKSRSVYDEDIIEETIKLIKYLDSCRDENGIGLLGPLTIQFFKTENGEIYLIEINPRFGGGVPLSFESGADYSKSLMDMIKGRKTEYIPEFKEVTMLRYDEAVFNEE